MYEFDFKNMESLPGSENETMPQEYRLRCLSAVMTECLALNLARSRID